jgi:hypothetical protein
MHACIYACTHPHTTYLLVLYMCMYACMYMYARMYICMYASTNYSPPGPGPIRGGGGMPVCTNALVHGHRGFICLIFWYAPMYTRNIGTVTCACVTAYHTLAHDHRVSSVEYSVMFRCTHAYWVHTHACTCLCDRHETVITGICGHLQWHLVFGHVRMHACLKGHKLMHIRAFKK